jgi:hypothetical protein
MDLYLGFRNYSGEVTTVGANAVTTVTRIEDNGNGPREVEVSRTTVAGAKRTADVEDFQIVMAGAMIKF